MERTTTKQQPSPDYRLAVESVADTWVPACGGYEMPFLHGGIAWLYVFNPARDEHGYLNIKTDIVQENPPWYLT